MMSDWEIRTRGVVTENFALVVACALVLAVAGGWVTYATYVDPGTHVEQRSGPSWETTGEFDHAATVEKPNSVYPVGAKLENRSAYYGAIAPRLDGNFTYGYVASEGGSLNVTADADVVLQAVERNQTGEVETRYWQKAGDVGRTQAAGAAPGESVRVPFSFNASALAAETDRIDEELGSSLGETEALVRVTVTLSGTVNGEPVERTERYELPVELGDAYTVADPGAVEERHATTRTVTVPDRYGPVRRFGGPALLVAGLGVGGGLVSMRRRDRLSPTRTETERLSFRESRGEFDEWIHTIDLPPSAFELPRAEAESLSDLVDFAIDTNSGVVEDPTSETYYVVHGGYLYVYSPPAADTAMPMAARERRPTSNDRTETDADDAAADAPEKSETGAPPGDENRSDERLD